LRALVKVGTKPPNIKSGIFSEAEQDLAVSYVTAIFKEGLKERDMETLKFFFSLKLSTSGGP